MLHYKKGNVCYVNRIVLNVCLKVVVTSVKMDGCCLKVCAMISVPRVHSPTKKGTNTVNIVNILVCNA